MFPVNERFLQVIEYLNVSAYKLSKKLDTSEAVLSNIKTGKNKPSIEIIEKLLNYYEVINGTWLITGKGNMLNSSYPKTNNLASYPCEECREKEKRINELIDMIDTQKKLINYLETKPVEHGQKRKAG